MSRKLDSKPDIQKYTQGTGAPLASEIRPTNGAAAPALPARRIASTGAMVMKMAAKSFATSRIAPQAKPFACRSAVLVSSTDRPVMPKNSAQPMTRSIAMVWPSSFMLPSFT